jgi:hypothetical protein
MNDQYHKELEARIDSALKALPALEAPSTLSQRVMTALERRSAVPWYRQSWEAWPLAARVGSLALLLSMFGGLCFVSWQLTRAAGTAAAFQEVGSLFSGVVVLWNAVLVLLQSAIVVCKHFGTVFIVASLFVMAVSYASCVGLGTVIYRAAFARR